MGYLQDNLLSEWIIGIYLHELTKTMNKNFQYHTRPPSAVLKISSLLLVNECRYITIIKEQ